MDFINMQIVKVQAAFAAHEEGQAMVEYGLILVLVSVVAVVGLTTVGGDLYNTDPAHLGVFNRVANGLLAGSGN